MRKAADSAMLPEACVLSFVLHCTVEIASLRLSVIQPWSHLRARLWAFVQLPEQWKPGKPSRTPHKSTPHRRHHCLRSPTLLQGKVEEEIRLGTFFPKPWDQKPGLDIKAAFCTVSAQMERRTYPASDLTISAFRLALWEAIYQAAKSVAFSKSRRFRI